MKYIFEAVITIGFIGLLLYIQWSYEKSHDLFDYPLTNDQVIERTIACSEKNRTPMMVYDNEMNIWAVKCEKK